MGRTLADSVLAARQRLDSDGWKSREAPLPHPLFIEPNGRWR
jgi:hypothetical protein